MSGQHDKSDNVHNIKKFVGMRIERIQQCMTIASPVTTGTFL